jgi:hypothetical protein
MFARWSPPSLKTSVAADDLVPDWYQREMAMNLRLSDEQTELLRARAEKEGRSMQQVALTAVDEYLLRAEDDEREGASRYEFT